ncbi:MAG: hypothetical protein NC120_12405 [Ruminococcus sp.]|nr:hypothetical protein [Ruminococcus sp.]
MTVNVIYNGVQAEQEEIDRYVDYCISKYKDKTVDEITVIFDGDYVDLSVGFAAVPFDRIRRITGYLVGSLDRWGDAKRSEERDRVKHM